MMKITQRTAAALVCASLAGGPAFFAPAPGYAQSRSDLKKAKQAFRDGKAAYDAEDYGKAAELFIEAHKYSNRSELYYNIGQAYRMAKNLEEAERYFQLYLENMPDAPNSEDVVNLILEIQKEIEAQLGIVVVKTPTGGASVFVDEEATPRCETPCDLKLKPGAYVVRVKNVAGVEATEGVTIGKAEKQTLDIPLPDKAPGRIVLISDGPGRVRIGTDVDEAVPMTEPIALQPGSYPVVLTEDSRGAIWKGNVEVASNETLTLQVPMAALAEAQGSGSWKKSVAYGLFGVAGAAGIGGALFGMQAQSTYDAVEAQSAAGGANADLVEAGKGEQSAANVLFITGGVALAAGVGLYLWDEFGGGGEELPEPEPLPSEVEEAAEESAKEEAPMVDALLDDEPEAPADSEEEKPAEEAPAQEEPADDDGAIDLL